MTVWAVSTEHWAEHVWYPCEVKENMTFMWCRMRVSIHSDNNFELSRDNNVCNCIEVGGVKGVRKTETVKWRRKNRMDTCGVFTCSFVNRNVFIIIIIIVGDEPPLFLGIELSREIAWIIICEHGRSIGWTSQCHESWRCYRISHIAIDNGKQLCCVYHRPSLQDKHEHSLSLCAESVCKHIAATFCDGRKTKKKKSNQ